MFFSRKFLVLAGVALTVVSVSSCGKSSDSTSPANVDHHDDLVKSTGTVSYPVGISYEQTETVNLKPTFTNMKGTPSFSMSAEDTAILTKLNIKLDAKSGLISGILPLDAPIGSVTVTVKTTSSEVTIPDFQVSFNVKKQTSIHYKKDTYTLYNGLKNDLTDFVPTFERQGTYTITSVSPRKRNDEFGMTNGVDVDIDQFMRTTHIGIDAATGQFIYVSEDASGKFVKDDKQKIGFFIDDKHKMPDTIAEKLVENFTIKVTYTNDKKETLTSADIFLDIDNHANSSFDFWDSPANPYSTNNQSVYLLNGVDAADHYSYKNVFYRHYQGEDFQIYGNLLGQAAVKADPSLPTGFNGIFDTKDNSVLVTKDQNTSPGKYEFNFNAAFSDGIMNQNAGFTLVLLPAKPKIIEWKYDGDALTISDASGIVGDALSCDDKAGDDNWPGNQTKHCQYNIILPVDNLQVIPYPKTPSDYDQYLPADYGYKYGLYTNLTDNDHPLNKDGYRQVKMDYTTKEGTKIRTYADPVAEKLYLNNLQWNEVKGQFDNDDINNNAGQFERVDKKIKVGYQPFTETFDTNGKIHDYAQQAPQTLVGKDNKTSYVVYAQNGFDILDTQSTVKGTSDGSYETDDSIHIPITLTLTQNK